MAGDNLLAEWTHDRIKVPGFIQDQSTAIEKGPFVTLRSGDIGIIDKRFAKQA